MKKELEEKLRYLQAHPTTGTAHNQQLISVQVETAFVVDELIGEIKKLGAQLERSDTQSEKLEKSNYRLQWAMLVLTVVSTFVAVYPLLRTLLVWMLQVVTPPIIGIPSMMSDSTMQLVVSFVASLLGLLVASLFTYQTHRIQDSYKLRNEMKIFHNFLKRNKKKIDQEES